MPDDIVGLLEADDKIVGRISIRRPVLTIGNDQDSDLVLRGPRVDARHAKVTFNGRQLAVEDDESAYGTLLNGVRVTRSTIADGDVIMVGRHHLRVREPVPEATAEPETIKAALRAGRRQGSRAEAAGYVTGYRLSEAIASGFYSALLSGRLRYVWVPLVLAGAVELALRVLNIQGSVDPELFSVLATTIPTLAIAIFVLLGSAGNPDLRHLHPADRLLHARGIGVGIGLQTLTGEALSIFGVATASSARALALLAVAAVIAQMVFLIGFTFYGPPRPPLRRADQPGGLPTSDGALRDDMGGPLSGKRRSAAESRRQRPS